MAKQTINLGTSANKGDGDPLRTAFDKVNDNFDELYAQDGNDVVLSSINASLIPDTDVAYDLGSASKRFRDLYLSGSTIDLGGTTLSIVGGELQLGGVKVPTQTDLDSAVGVVDGLVAGEGIPALLTAYTDQSAVVDSLLNAGDYGGDLVAPSNYTFYDLVVARRAANPLIPQELEDEALAQLNAYNAWQAEIAADKATITVGDYAWNFKGDGDLTIAGNIEIDGSFINNSVSDGTGLQVETTSDFEIKVDTAIWSFEPNDGGRIQFPDGSTQTTAWNGVGDLTGSVFADDSTLLVDSVAGKIVGPVDTASITFADDTVQTTAYVERFVNRSTFTSDYTITSGSTGVLNFDSYQGQQAFDGEFETFPGQWTAGSTGLYRLDFVLGLKAAQELELIIFLFEVAGPANALTLFNGVFNGTTMSVSGTAYLTAGQRYSFAIIQSSGDDVILDKDFTSVGIEQLT